MTTNSNLDRLVLDQRKAVRNPQTTAAVRSSRRKLVANAIDEDSATEALLAKSAGSVPTHSLAMIVLVTVVSAIGTQLLGSFMPLLWGIATVALYVATGLLLRITARGNTSRVLPLHVLNAMTGASWVWFVHIPEFAGDGMVTHVYRADTLLAAMAVGALLQANVRNAIPVAFGPACLAMIFHIDGAANASAFAAFAVASGGLTFFSLIAMRTRTANIVALRLEREKDALIGELETAKAISDSARHKAEEANLAKSRFLASMSHELRTPLNAILGFSEVMVEEILGPVENPTYAEYVRDIQGSGRHLLALINEILDLSRIEANKYPLDLRPHELADITHGAAATLRVHAARKGIKIEERFAPSLSRLALDERAITQAVLNLLSNAIKFTPQNGQVVVSVGQTAGGGQYVSIIDNGPGIPKEELPLVMSAFGQGSIALKHAEQGTGLGLAIVKALIERHGGKFTLSSRLREGTTATLLFPAQTTEQPNLDAKIAA